MSLPEQITALVWDNLHWFIEIPEHTETPEHTGNYWSTLSYIIFCIINVRFYDLIVNNISIVTFHAMHLHNLIFQRILFVSNYTDTNP